MDRKLSKKKLLIVFIIALKVCIILELISSRYTLSFTIPGQECFPYKFWLVYKKDKTVYRDKYVAFKGNNIPYYINGTRWTKLVAGIEGDVVRVERVNYKKTIYKGGMPREVQVWAIVKLIRNDGKTLTLEAYKTDTMQRRLPLIEEQVIPKGKFFAYSPHERSYDSRYWGLADVSWVIGSARPLF